MHAGLDGDSQKTTNSAVRRENGERLESVDCVEKVWHGGSLSNIRI
jgi:hypothetical protein